MPAPGPANPVLATIGAPEPVHMIQAGGAILAVKRWGAGPPILCLHAAGHGSGDFLPFAERVGDRFEVVALDWPGQGRSPADGGPVRAQHYAELALSACDVLQLDRPILIGNSIGGAAALIAAARAPERVSALVLCNAGGLAPVDRLARLVTRRMAASFRAGAGSARWFPLAFDAYYRTLVLTAAPARPQRARIVAAARVLAPVLAEAFAGFSTPDADLRDLAGQVSVPVWLAWAKGDQFVSWRRSRPAAQSFARSRTTLFPGSHAAFLEAPDQFAAAFLRFAATLTRA